MDQQAEKHGAGPMCRDTCSQYLSLQHFIQATKQRSTLLIYTANIGTFVVITAYFSEFEHFGFSMSLKDAGENANNADPY